MQNLNFITLLVAVFITATAETAPQKYQYGQENTIAIREMRASIDEMRHEMNNHETEIRTFEEKLANQETIIETLREQNVNMTKSNQSATKGSITNLEMKINSLDTASKGLVSDLRELKNHTNQSTTSIGSFNQKIGDIEKALDVQAQNLDDLKTALRSVMAILEVKHDLGPSEDTKAKFYRVQAGDSLEKIAKLHKITVKAIKELNDLSSDRIVIGQNIKIP